MTSLARYDAMRHALAECSRIDDAKAIADKATALAAYARQSHDVELESWVSEIKLRAKRRIGELSAALDSAQGSNQHLPKAGKILKSEALAEAGLSVSEAQRCERLKAVEPQVFERYLAERKAAGAPVHIGEVLKLAPKKEKKAKVVETIEAFEGCTVAELDSLVAAGQKFGCIYADPPWVYDNQSTRASTSNHYNGLSVDELCQLPVKALAAKDAQLHLWTTNAFLFDAPKIFDAWGFEFRSTFVWVKPQMGIGNYWRNSHEMMLTAVRGDAKRFNDHSMMSWGKFDRSQHSAKPEQIRDMLVKATGGPYLELFGRRKTDGWTVWGNQIERNLFHAEAA